MTPPANSLSSAEAALDRRDLPAAAHHLDLAEAQDSEPDHCASLRWTLAMLHGDLEAAWRASDAIRARGQPDPHRLWNGEDLTGRRIVLRCLHGFGDSVQLLRFAPLLAARAQSLTVEVAPAFLPLAPLFAGVSHVISWGAHAPAFPPAWDLQLEINELPYALRIQASQLPFATRYLTLPPTLLASVSTQPHAPRALRVGLVWSSGEWNPLRSIPPALLHPILALPGIEFWNLQGGPARDAWQLFPDDPRLHPAPQCAASLPHLAAYIAQLDLVLTPDTLAAHLAGALGTPAFVLLPHAADWRWQHARTRSPWYPSLRLFRQPTPGDWASVPAPVAHALTTLAHAHTDRPLVASA